jgi:hypothetical protein
MIARGQVAFAGAWLAALVVAPQARATQPERTFHVEYAASAGCPDESRFVEAILARAAGAEHVALPAAVVRLRVELRHDSATLWVELAEGRLRREISAASCADVMEAMAVMSAIVIEAEPGSRLTASDAFEFVPKPTADATPPKAAPESTPADPASAPSAATTPSAGIHRPPRPRAPAALTLGFVAELAMESAVASAPPLGAALGAEIGGARQGRWGLATRVELFATLPATEVAAPYGEAELRLIAGRWNACAQRALGAFSVQPCATLDVGTLWGQGAGEQVLNPTEGSMLWLAPGLLLRGRYVVAAPVSLEAALGAKLLTRGGSGFVFGPPPHRTAYQLPNASLSAQIGLYLAIF